MIENIAKTLTVNSAILGTGFTAPKLSSSEKQVDNFLKTRNFHSTMAASIREEMAIEENAKATNKVIQNGIWTIHNTVKNTHRTFKIHTARSGRFGQKRFVSLLVGSDNLEAYEGFAFVDSDSKSINVWIKHQKNQDGSKSDFAKFAEILVDLFCNDGKKFGKFCTLKGATTCLRCNRALTVPSSIDARYGKECASKMINGF